MGPMGIVFFGALVFFFVFQKKSLTGFDLKDRQARAAHTCSQTPSAVGEEEDTSKKFWISSLCNQRYDMRSILCFLGKLL